MESRWTLFWLIVLTLSCQQVCEACFGCDPVTTASCSSGSCSCIKHTTGDTCKLIQDGYYMPDLDDRSIVPVESTCRLVTASTQQVSSGLGEIVTVCNGSLGEGERYIRFTTLEGLTKQKTDESKYRLVLRHVYSGDHPSLLGRLSVRVGGNDRRHTADTASCPLSPEQVTSHNIIFRKENPDVHATQALHSDCAYTIELYVRLPDERNFSLIMDRLSVMPDIREFTVYKNADAVTKNEYLTCLKSYSVATRTPKTPACWDMAFSVMAELEKLAQAGTSPANMVLGLGCDCDQTGSESSVCLRVGGRCSCKRGVTGRTCDHCLPGYHGFSTQGCQTCPDGVCNRFIGPDALMGVITVVSVSLVAILSLILIMTLPTSKYGRLCVCYDEDKKIENRKTPEEGLKIQRSNSVRGTMETYVNLSMAPVGILPSQEEPPRSDQSGFKKRDSLRSLGPFVPNKSAGARQKGRKDKTPQSAPKTAARMGSGLGAVGM